MKRNIIFGWISLDNFIKQTSGIWLNSLFVIRGILRIGGILCSGSEICVERVCCITQEYPDIPLSVTHPFVDIIYPFLKQSGCLPSFLLWNPNQRQPTDFNWLETSWCARSSNDASNQTQCRQTLLLVVPGHLAIVDITAFNSQVLDK